MLTLKKIFKKLFYFLFLPALGVYIIFFELVFFLEDEDMFGETLGILLTCNLMVLFLVIFCLALYCIFTKRKPSLKFIIPTWAAWTLVSSISLYVLEISGFWKYNVYFLYFAINYLTYALIIFLITLITTIYVICRIKNKSLKSSFKEVVITTVILSAIFFSIFQWRIARHYVGSINLEWFIGVRDMFEYFTLRREETDFAYNLAFKKIWTFNILSFIGALMLIKLFPDKNK